MSNNRRALVAVLPLVLLACSLDAMAQISGSVAGIVMDNSGGAVPGTTITLKEVDTGVIQTTDTNGVGEYLFPVVTVGKYTVSAAKQGFQTSEVANVVVLLQEQRRVDFTLQVGATASKVEVVSQTVEALQTDSGAVQGIVDSQQILNLPLNGRNFQQLVGLQPNDVPSPQRSSFTTTFGGYNVVSGAPTSATILTIDGVQIQDLNNPFAGILLNLDVIQEFQEARGGYGSDEGKGAGAHVNLVTKSGTDQFHGSLFEFARNTVLNARNFYDVTKAPYNLNQFGGSLGGPILKGKTFFFVGYEGIRLASFTTSLFSVPSTIEREGNFSDILPKVIYDPTTYDATTNLRQAYAGNIMPTTEISDVSAKALQLLFTPPNLPGTFNNLSGHVINNNTNNQYSVRGDHVIGPKDSLFARFINYPMTRVTGADSGQPPIADNWNTHSKNAAVGWVHTFNAATVNQFRLGYNRLIQVLQDTEANVPLNQEVGIYVPGQVFQGHPLIELSGLSSSADQCNAPNNRTDNGFYVYDDLEHLHGRHSLKAGYSDAIEQLNGGLNIASRGYFFFNPVFTAQVGATPTSTVANTGYALADMMLGDVYESEDEVGVGYRDFRQDRYGAYFNDDWKATKHLTVNMGVRWEYFQPAYELRNHLSAFNPTTDSLVIAGQNGTPRGFRNSEWTDFEPRVGAAYLLPGGKTVIRGAYGFYFNPMLIYPYPFLNLNNPPFLTHQLFVATRPTDDLSFADAFPTNVTAANANSAVSLNSMALNMKNPYIQQWDLAVQQQLSPTMNIDIGYLGNHGSRLPFGLNINTPTLGVTTTDPYPNFGEIETDEGIAVSNYESLYVKATKRVSNGVTFVASYTWAHLLSDGGIEDAGDLSYPAVRNAQDPGLEYGNDFFDVRHRFTGSYIYVLPVGSGHLVGSDWSGARNEVLGGWQLNGIISVQTGPPFTPVLSVDNTGLGVGTSRPNQIASCGAGAPHTVQDWFNTAAFVTPPAGSYGNEGVNTCFAPGLATADLSLFKQFRLPFKGEDKRLEFRTEWFNSFNRANFYPPNATFGVASFGTISAAGPPRQVQFAMKLLF